MDFLIAKSYYYQLAELNYRLNCLLSVPPGFVDVKHMVYAQSFNCTTHKFLKTFEEIGEENGIVRVYCSVHWLTLQFHILSCYGKYMFWI